MKTLIILPYFGKLNSYFSLWLKSCEYNADFDWLFLTDCNIELGVPNNIKIVYTSLNALRESFRNKLDLEICLDTPYKLCDYKQYYGYLFEEYLSDYDYWGYCDCDLIFGDIRSFITEEIQNTYDKILRTGHLTFVRNDTKLNRNFLKYDTYKISLTSPVIYGYDESVYGYHLGFAGELLDQGYTFLDKPEWIADIDFRHYPFYEVSMPDIATVYSFEQGKVFRIIRRDTGELQKDERMYVHLQKRKMELTSQIDKQKYLIYPNKFATYDQDMIQNQSFWNNVQLEKEGYYNFSDERKEERFRTIKRFLHEPRKIDSIRYRLRK